MDLLKGILVFAGLTSPLWLIVIMIPVSILVAVMVSRRFPSTGTRILAGAVVLLAFFLALFGDEIAGRAYLKYLCGTEAGVKVYQTVKLPAQYWDERGNPRFFDERNGNFSLEGYEVKYTTGNRSSLFHIEKAGYKRIDSQSGAVLGEVTDFRSWGGWVRRYLSTHNTASGCSSRRVWSNELVKEVFKKGSH